MPLYRVYTSIDVETLVESTSQQGAIDFTRRLSPEQLIVTADHVEPIVDVDSTEEEYHVTGEYSKAIQEVSFSF